jgi:glycosyltransferase involved in cell wall biosynthesis
MKTNGLITIIIPVYNVESFLYDCLLSVANQSYKNFECICINDESPDNSTSIIKDFCKKDDRFKLIEQKNIGVGATRNKGIDLAKGEYITFLDSDDCYHPDFLLTLFNDINKYNTDFSSCNYQRVNELFEYKNFEHENEVNNIFISNRPVYDFFKRKVSLKVTVWNKLYRQELIKDIKFKEGIHPAEDDIFIFETLIKSKSFSYNNSKLVYYRKRTGAATEFFRIDNNYKAAIEISKVLNNANTNKENKKLLKVKASRRVFNEVYSIPMKLEPENQSIYIDRLKKLEELNLFNPKYLSLLKFIKYEINKRRV